MLVAPKARRNRVEVPCPKQEKFTLHSIGVKRNSVDSRVEPAYKGRGVIAINNASVTPPDKYIYEYTPTLGKQACGSGITLSVIIKTLCLYGFFVAFIS